VKREKWLGFEIQNQKFKGGWLEGLSEKWVSINKKSQTIRLNEKEKESSCYPSVCWRSSP
jgi:hypothetical protein